MAIGIYILIITLNINRLNAPKDMGWLNGYKNKIWWGWGVVPRWWRIGQEDHFLPHKFIKRSFECLNASRGHQAPRKRSSCHTVGNPLTGVSVGSFGIS